MTSLITVAIVIFAISCIVEKLKISGLAITLTLFVAAVCFALVDGSAAHNLIASFVR